MAATRVYILAKELGVKSTAIVQKCQDEGLDVKNHMSTISAGLAATIREWFSEGAASGTAVESAEHVDLDTARKEAKKSRRKRSKKAQEQAAVDEALAAAEEAKQAEAAAEEAPAVAGQEPPPAEAVPETAVATEAPEGIVGAVEGAEAPAEGASQPAAAPDEAAEPSPEPTKAAEKPVEPPKEAIKPAGPQVVPKPAELRGPRVVRVERPDFVPAPPSGRAPRTPRQPAASESPAGRLTIGSGKPAGGAPGETEGRDKRKSKRRSPRRKGGRSADSGEKLREWREQDLLERSERLAAAGGGLRRRRASVSQKQAGARLALTGGKVEISEPITVKSLSAATGIKSAAIIKKLMGMGTMATINQLVDNDTAELIASEYEIELVIQHAKTAEEEMVEQLQARPAGQQTPRAPVVTFLGHVDHGKTSLLDHIRQTSVAPGEAGGITKHIGAYRYDAGNNHVVFLDTPGHQAFTAMRARGANMTDVVVLVVAADDGVMPQTEEAISHARAAGVPIVVALNKIDLPNANVNRVMGQLAEHDLQPQEWGGETEVIQTSAATGEGMDKLVETLSLEAEILELTADESAAATGYVVEARVDTGRGILATLLVRDGTLKVGDVIVAGRSFGRVRQIVDSHGKPADQVGPATPVEITGLDEMPDAGDRFYVIEDIDQARAVAEDRRRRSREAELAVAPKRSLQDLLSQIEAGEANELPLIIKADVQGSIEALRGQLEKLNTDEVRVNILHTAVGGISTGDVSLAEASDAIIIGFNVVADANARELAEKSKVEIRLYRVIYDIVEDVRKALEEGLEPEIREETLGRAQIRQLFKVSRVGTIAGCIVSEGTISRNAKLRIIRDNVVIEDERGLDSLRRVKDDVREVRSGLECGLKITGYDDLKEGDVLEFYRQVEVTRRL